MVNSMTGFAAQEFSSGGLVRSWELRSVNGKGLDIRMRLPDKLGHLEGPVREKIKAVTGRGNVTVSLRLSKEDTASGIAINEAALSSMLSALTHARNAAEAQGLPVADVTPAQILTLPGVIGDAKSAVDLPEDAVLLAELDTVLAEFLSARAQEGLALLDTLAGQIAQMKPLVAAAAARAAARHESAAERLKANINAVLESADGIDPDRLAQEIAVLAVKSDVTEEIDRLANAHIPAAADLLNASGPIGRRFDFLMQEFNREANTLCSKSQDATLTQLGLDLKVVIDQMREQVQNVE